MSVTWAEKWLALWCFEDMLKIKQINTDVFFFTYWNFVNYGPHFGYYSKNWLWDKRCGVAKMLTQLVLVRSPLALYSDTLLLLWKLCGVLANQYLKLKSITQTTRHKYVDYCQLSNCWFSQTSTSAALHSPFSPSCSGGRREDDRNRATRGLHHQSQERQPCRCCGTPSSRCLLFPSSSYRIADFTFSFFDDGGLSTRQVVKA